ncbi:hypothetical protein [Flavobacterium sp. FlaQc-47]|uniref:hypothetical protein n=1 Tax=Flavobacterium sp. FlaQc-47 TaxID=3374180 RepID=UPI003757DE47
MRKLSILKSTFSLVLVLTMSILLVNCSSSSNDDDYGPSTGNTFNPTDFALTIRKTELNDGNKWMMSVYYDLKNTSQISYNKYEQGSFNIRFTVKSTDGTIYQTVTSIPYIEAGVTVGDFTYLDAVNNTKTLDPATLTAVIEKQ